MPYPRSPRLVLADDHRLVAEALRMALQSRFAIVGVAAGGAELMAMLRETEADALLLDMAMPGRNGLELIPAVRKLRPRLRIVIVTMMAEPLVAQAALRAGAHGFVPKDVRVVELAEAIERVLAGEVYLSPRVPRSSRRLGTEARHVALHRLTPRQQQIVMLLGEGLAACDVGRLLGVSPSTVTFHKHNIMRILGLESDAALVRYAVLLRAVAESETNVAVDAAEGFARLDGGVARRPQPGSRRTSPVGGA